VPSKSLFTKDILFEVEEELALGSSLGDLNGSEPIF
jgi:hypothetical protein